MSTILPLLQQAVAEGRSPEGLGMVLPPTIAKTVGFDMVSVDRGEAVFRLVVDKTRHANPMGTLHGGALTAIADSAMGMACMSLLEEGTSFTTVELKVNFFRPVTEGIVEARAKVVNGGRTLVYVECDVVTVPEGKLVAKTNSTCLVLRGDQAKGR